MLIDPHRTPSPSSLQFPLRSLEKLHTTTCMSALCFTRERTLRPRRLVLSFSFPITRESKARRTDDVYHKEEVPRVHSENSVPEVNHPRLHTVPGVNLDCCGVNNRRDDGTQQIEIVCICVRVCAIHVSDDYTIQNRDTGKERE